MEPLDALADPESSPRVRRRKLVRRAFGIGLGLSAILLVGPLSILAFLGETKPGRLLGWLSIAMLGAVCAGVASIWPMPRPRVWGTVACGLLLVVVGLLIGSDVRSDAERFGGPTGLRSVVLGPADPMKPGLLGLLPEIDLVKLGAAFMSRLVPDTSPEHRRRIRDETLRLYREIEADPDARPIRSATPLALAELMGRPFDAGHYFAYVPPHAPEERLGAIVFLHGNAGNFKINPWVWRRFAEAHRFAIVCPSFGFGFWGERGVEAIERAVDDAIPRLGIDPDRIYLAGLSDGGKGVTRSARAHPGRYRGLVYISPTMEIDEISSADFLAAWRGRHVLVLHGDADVNVREGDVIPAIEALRSNGVITTYRLFPEEDHFLLFGRSDEVMDDVARWIRFSR